MSILLVIYYGKWVFLANGKKLLWPEGGWSQNFCPCNMQMILFPLGDRGLEFWLIWQKECRGSGILEVLSPGIKKSIKVASSYGAARHHGRNPGYPVNWEVHVEMSWLMRYQLERKATWRNTRLQTTSFSCKHSYHLTATTWETLRQKQ